MKSITIQQKKQSIFGNISTVISNDVLKQQQVNINPVANKSIACLGNDGEAKKDIDHHKHHFTTVIPDANKAVSYLENVGTKSKDVDHHKHYFTTIVPDAKNAIAYLENDGMKSKDIDHHKHYFTTKVPDDIKSFIPKCPPNKKKPIFQPLRPYVFGDGSEGTKSKPVRLFLFDL